MLGSQLTLVKVQQAILEFGLANVLLGLLGAAVTVIAIDYGWMLYMRSRMPPGPFPLPIVGNTYSLPDTKPWIYFEELSKKYKAPLVTCWIGR